MIKMDSLKPSGGFKRELKIETDEKSTIKFLETANGDILVFVFKGIGSDIEDWHEPIGIFNSRSKNNNWSVK